MTIVLIIIEILFSIPVSWGIAYIITMIIFWVDLNINNQDRDKEIRLYLQKKHLDMNLYVNIFVFIVLLFFIIKFNFFRA